MYFFKNFLKNVINIIMYTFLSKNQFSILSWFLQKYFFLANVLYFLFMKKKLFFNFTLVLNNFTYISVYFSPSLISTTSLFAQLNLLVLSIIFYVYYLQMISGLITLNIQYLLFLNELTFQLLIYNKFSDIYFCEN